MVNEYGNKIQDDEVGELIFKGPQITMGYLHDPEKTATVFVVFDWDKTGARWYRTGDMGVFNQDNDLECIGRRDNQIKLAGRRIEIGEIEAVLARYPQTKDAVVVPLRDTNEVVIGCVAFTCSILSKPDESFIRQDSTKFMERIFFPKRIISLDVIPRSSSGKIDRKALSELSEKYKF